MELFVCNKYVKMSGNTSNLAAHMKHHQIDEDKPLNTLDSSFRPSISAALDITYSTPDDPAIASTSSTNISTETSQLKERSFSNVSIQTPKIDETFLNISKYSQGGSKYDQITNAIAYFICLDNRPFNLVEGKGFNYLMKQVLPLYKMPSRETIKARIDKKYDIVSKIIQKKLKEVKNFCIATDIWTETMSNTSFLGITIHFLLDSQLLSIMIGVLELHDSHTAEYIGMQLSKILTDWGIESDKIMAFITDSGANMVKAIKDTFGNDKHIPCFAHLINLVAENAIRKTSELSNLIDRVRDIVKYIKRKVLITAELKRKQIENYVQEGKTLKVILDVKTRWNSLYYMLSGFVELAPYISEVIFSKIDAPAMVTAVELAIIKDVAIILQPLEAMTKEASGQQYITVSKVVPMVSCIIDHYSEVNLSTICSIAEGLKKNILLQMEKRFGQLEYLSMLAVSTLLDPRFKNLHFKKPDACDKAMVKVCQLIIKNKEVFNISLSSEDEENKDYDFWQYHKSLAHKQVKRRKIDSDDELTSFLAAPVSTLKSNPIESWQEMQGSYPNLFKIAMAHLPIVATSVPAERLFSKAGATITQARNRLTGKRLGKLLFLSSVEHKILGYITL